MKICTIIPAKPFEHAKTRLAPVIGALEREDLARRLFLHVLKTTLRFSGPVVVVSRSREVLRLAQSEGAVGLKEMCRPDLNAALEQAAKYAHARGALKLLIVPGDLPLLDLPDLRALARETCAIAPDRLGRGTNALLWPATHRPKFQFGIDSFRSHWNSAKALGLRPRAIVREGFAHDIDVPGDLLGTVPSYGRAGAERR